MELRMKKVIAILLSSLIVSTLFSVEPEDLKSFEYKGIFFEVHSSSLNWRLSNKNEFFIQTFYGVKYENDVISGSEYRFIDTKYTPLLTKLCKTRMITYDGANVTPIHSSDCRSFAMNTGLPIKEYVSAVGNGWASDNFGFIIPMTNKGYSTIEFRFLNIYSTWIEKGGYKTLWNRETVRDYPDQSNPGIQFYYILEDLFRDMNTDNTIFSITGKVNDERVRFRTENNLNCETLRLFDNGEVLEILDCDEGKTQIGDDSYPWIKVKSAAGETGYIYGKYIDITVQ